MPTSSSRVYGRSQDMRHITIKYTAVIPAVYWGKANQFKNVNNMQYPTPSKNLSRAIKSPYAANSAVYEDISPRCIGVLNHSSETIRRTANTTTISIQNLREVYFKFFKTNKQMNELRKLIRSVGKN